MSNKKVLYLVSRENIAAPGVMKSQVLDLIWEIVRNRRGIEITIINFPSLPNFLKNFKNYQSVRNFCRRRGIGLVIIPILPVGPSFMPVWAVPFFLVQTVPLVLFFSIKYGINIIHARSYLSAFSGYLVKKILGIKLVFDTRSLYLIEAKMLGGWGESDASYKFWKIIERNLLIFADSVVIQASKIGEYVREAVPNTQVSLIPSPVDVEKFRMLTRFREKEREKNGISDKFVFAYSGSLGGLHDPFFLAKFYSSVSKHVKTPHFLVATQSDPAIFLQVMKDLEGKDEEVTVLSNPDLGKILPLADAGLHVYGDVPIAPYVSSVKLPEYTASGVPPIVTSNMISMGKLVRDNRCGVVIDSFDQNDIRVKMRQLVKEHKILKKNSLKLARDYFSVKVCARKYLDIYDELIQKNKF